jgi:diaminopimelate decarboxylase
VTPVPRHLLPATAAVAPGGRLAVGGVDLVDLADELGTPLFVYDEAHLRARCRESVAAWGSGVAYASKAFLCKAMAALAYEEGMSIDVSTGGELSVALAAGVPPEDIVVHGNNKSEPMLARSLELGVRRIVVDSFDEIDRIERIGGSSQPVLVRVTPGIEAHTHGYVMTGQDDSKFGFGLASGAAEEAAERLTRSSAVRLVGVHMHIGSQIFRTDSFAQAVKAVAGFLGRFRLEELCVGGGLGVPYVEGESAPSITEWAEAVRKACADAGIASTVRVTAEPGRSVVAAAAVTLYRVGTIKDLTGIRTYVSVDGGMSDNPRPVLYGSGYEAFLPRAVDAPRTRAVTIVGEHCESGDVVVEDARLPGDLAVGDVLATPVTGAYGYAMASNYNKVPRPAVVFVRDGEARVVVRRETVEDLLRLDA